ncbi:MAG: hypothetical protein AMS21_00665 [Gemmatimonas sp. SG8_38_2]|nr:MAG: hypothetical protein AMS21_00665 [Gemmatimonas sp. SG8_38_2]
MIDKDAFIKGYKWCAVFTDQPEHMCESGEFTWEMARKRLAMLPRHVHHEMEADCNRFLKKHGHMINPGEEEDIGRYFWYDRQGHGTGAWDHEDELGKRAKLLTEAAAAFGTYDEVCLCLSGDYDESPDPVLETIDNEVIILEKKRETNCFVECAVESAKNRLISDAIDALGRVRKVYLLERKDNDGR